MNTHYLCHKINENIPMDGKLEHPVWQKALKTRRFVDIIGGNPGLYDTHAAMLYDDENLYIGFWCEEPFPHATITQRDGLLWFENDLEVFIDGGDCYYEFQLSALNTVYEVLYIWQDVYEKNGWSKKAEFDILRNGAITFGGNYDRTGHYSGVVHIRVATVGPIFVGTFQVCKPLCMLMAFSMIVPRLARDGQH